MKFWMRFYGYNIFILKFTFVHGKNHYLSPYSSTIFCYSFKIYLSTYVGFYLTLLQVDINCSCALLCLLGNKPRHLGVNTTMFSSLSFGVFLETKTLPSFFCWWAVHGWLMLCCTAHEYVYWNKWMIRINVQIRHAYLHLTYNFCISIVINRLEMKICKIYQNC